MFGESFGTGPLLDSLRDYVGYVHTDYERGCYEDAEQNAKLLMQGAMELWTRMVELRGDAR